MPEVLVLDLGLSGLVDLEAPRRAMALWGSREAHRSLLTGSVSPQATPSPWLLFKQGLLTLCRGVCHDSAVT